MVRRLKHAALWLFAAAVTVFMQTLTGILITLLVMVPILIVIALKTPKLDRPSLQRSGTQPVRAVAKWVTIGAFGLLALAIVLTAGGVRSPFPPTEVTSRKPYSDFIGREYRVVSNVSAYAWNEFPDKATIRSISIMPPPGTANRFVSSVRPLQLGQAIRIVSAWREFPSFAKYYVVSVPGAGLPEGIPITMRVKSDGTPDPSVYELMER